LAPRYEQQRPSAIGKSQKLCGSEVFRKGFRKNVLRPVPEEVIALLALFFCNHALAPSGCCAAQEQIQATPL
jgi:hypothetical protein